mmetsp:Transcript_5980/g.16509  ORF Transcript_5980/g.16509 Transcript_5980/m.16509 type:complete len:206 (-) Transcript_5980:158-775(-)
MLRFSASAECKSLPSHSVLLFGLPLFHGCVIVRLFPRWLRCERPTDTRMLVDAEAAKPKTHAKCIALVQLIAERLILTSLELIRHTLVGGFTKGKCNARGDQVHKQVRPRMGHHHSGDFLEVLVGDACVCTRSRRSTGRGDDRPPDNIVGRGTIRIKLRHQTIWFALHVLPFPASAWLELAASKCFVESEQPLQIDCAVRQLLDF